MKYLLAKAGALTLVTLTTSLVAEPDTKVYSSGFCKPQHTADAIDYGFSNGALVAEEGGAFFCPLIRDNTGSAQGIDYVWIEVFHPNASVPECFLYSNREDQQASLVDWVWGVAVSDPGETGFDQIVFNATSVAWPIETSSGNEGAYSIYCELGPGMEIQQITVGEN